MHVEVSPAYIASQVMLAAVNSHVDICNLCGAQQGIGKLVRLYFFALMKFLSLIFFVFSSLTSRRTCAHAHLVLALTHLVLALT